MIVELLVVAVVVGLALTHVVRSVRDECSGPKPGCSGRCEGCALRQGRPRDKDR